MIDIKLIREHPDLVRQNLARRKDKTKLELVNKAVKADKAWRASLQKLEKLKHEKNLATKKIAASGKSSKVISRIKKINKEIEKLNDRTRKNKKQLTKIMFQIPNLLHESVPYGEDEHDNVEIRRWGKIPKKGFKPKDHLTIIEKLSVIDKERASKVSGNAFYYLKE